MADTKIQSESTQGQASSSQVEDYAHSPQSAQSTLQSMAGKELSAANAEYQRKVFYEQLGLFRQFLPF